MADTMADRTTGVLMAPAADRGTQGLYDGRYEHDACGVGFVADLSGRRSHHIVTQALTVLRNLEHRGAKGSDPDTGDGAGILTQIPDGMFRAACEFSLPEPGRYAAGMVVLPAGEPDRPRALPSPHRLPPLLRLPPPRRTHLPHNPA